MQSRATGIATWVLAAIALTSPARAELIANGTFDTNVDGWIDPGAVAGTEFGWTSSDPHDDPLSGSMYVWTNVPEAGLDGPWQCVATAPGAYTLTAATLVTIPTQHVDPFVEMSLDFFAAEECTGAAIASGNAVALKTSSWETLSVPLEAPAGTESARVRFLVGGTYDTWVDVALFDDVSLVPEAGGEPLRASALAVLAAVRWIRRRS